MYSKKKAFTLTELLVVVIVLGVLAAVSVPRFSRVLETRKTTEAENILTAVRTEQENRCVFGKDYLSDSSQLSMLSGVNDPNYTYSLGTQGITATSKNKGYQLKMLSYKDGQICCEGAYCDSLNKDYVRCSSLTVGVDECAADSAEEEPEVSYECSGSALTGQLCSSCGGTRTRTATCNHSTGTWEYGEWSECSIPESSCSSSGCDEDTKPETSQECNGCGTQSRSVSCVAGKWVASNWGACSKTEEECNTASGSACKGTRPSEFETSCGCGTMTVKYTCNEETGQWQTIISECVLPDGACQNGDTETMKVPYIVRENGVPVTKYYTQKRTCSNCSWGEWERVSEDSDEENCTYGVTGRQQTVSVPVSGCNTPQWSSLAHPGGAPRCSSTSASACPFDPCTNGALSGTAKALLQNGSTVSFSSLSCSNIGGQNVWGYNGSAAVNITVDFVIYQCQQNCESSS